MAKLYNGPSEGFSQVADGFVEYALEVGINRSFASIHDGFKPVQRRIVYALNEGKVYKLTKAAKAVGMVLGYHPHGDGSVYEAMCRMVRSNGSIRPSLADGEGNFSRSYSNSSPAGMRYPSLMLSKEAIELFLDDMEGIEWKETETDEGLEPVYLPAKFPMALTASVQGMGVGIANKVPSYNFNEVLDLTKQYISDGEQFSNQIIYPDLPNGGIVVANNKEMAKIMTTGRGHVKSRAKVSIQKKDVIIEELPYNTTDGSVVARIKELVRSNKKAKLKDGRPNPNYGKFPYITREDDVVLTSDLSGFSIRLRCRKAADTEIVVKELSRRGILTNSFHSNMIFTNGHHLVVTGVYGVIEEWLANRKKVLTKKFNHHLKGLKKEEFVLDFFLRLIGNPEWRNQYLHLLTNVGISEANSYLSELFEDITADVCSWIASRRASAFLDGGKYAVRLQNIKDSIKFYETALKDLNSYIYNELEEIQKKFGHLYPRKTEVTFTDFKFTKRVEEVPEDESYCGYVLYSDGRLQKTSSIEGYEGKEGVVMAFSGRGNSILVGFDYVGNVIRVYGNDIPYGYTDLKDYLGVRGLVDDYKITYLTVVDGSRKRLLYRDGRMSVLDTSEFIGKKNRKRLIRNGVPEDVDDQLVEVFNEEDLKQYLYVADESGKLAMGILDWETLNIKSRTAKTRAFTGSKTMNITQWGTCDLEDAQRYFTSMEDFVGRVRKVKQGDVTFDGSEFTLGRFLNG